MLRCFINSYFQRRPARDEALLGRGEAPAHSTRSVHITCSLRDPSPPRPRTSTHDPRPPQPRLFQRQVGCQEHAGGVYERSAGAYSTVKVITYDVRRYMYEAALLGPQEGDHLLGCRHLHPLGYVHRRDRGHHLGGSSSVWRSTRRGLACSSTSSSGDESFGTCLEHARNVMKLCSFKRMADVLAQQPVLSGAVVLVRACAAV